MKPKLVPLEKIIAKGGDYLRRKNLFEIKTFLDNLGIVKFIRRFNASVDSLTTNPLISINTKRKRAFSIEV